jgi:hypothetical protein
MTIDLTARELSDILEGLDNAIECMADWSDDELNTARDRRGHQPKDPQVLAPGQKANRLRAKPLHGGFGQGSQSWLWNGRYSQWDGAG